MFLTFFLNGSDKRINQQAVSTTLIASVCPISVLNYNNHLDFQLTSLLQENFSLSWFDFLKGPNDLKTSFDIARFLRDSI